MKIISFGFLLLVSGSCLLNQAEATDFEPVQPFGFIGAVEDFFKAVLSTVQGVTCTIDETAHVMLATTKFITEIGQCGLDVPKDVADIVNSCANIVNICDSMVHMKSKMCAAKDGEDKTSTLCFTKVLFSTLKLVREMHDVIHGIAELGPNTESCFLDATDAIVVSYNSYLPNIQKCCDKFKF